MSIIRSLSVYIQPNVIRMLFLGFSAGLPLLLILGTLSFWLREAGLNLSTIGFFSWVGLVYAFKWVWSPLVDKLPILFLTSRFGRRRAWLLLSQSLIILGLVGVATHDPSEQLTFVVLFALLSAFSSATQDIALDAFRIESGAIDDQGAMAATYQIGYRIAMIVSSAGALFLASWLDTKPDAYDASSWTQTYLIMAGLMFIGIATTLLSPEPNGHETSVKHERQIHRPRIYRILDWLQEAVFMPFSDFFKRYRYRALVLLAMIALYRISDVVMGVMANPFYLDMGFTKQDIAAVSKVFGVVMTLLGALLGGLLVKQVGIFRVLLLGAILSSATNLLFSWMSGLDASLAHLTLTVSLDNFSAGIASAAFIAYLSSLTNVQYSATQYALFSSLMFLLPKTIAGWSGVYVEQFGYEHFFTATALIGVPSIALVYLAKKLS